MKNFQEHLFHKRLRATASGCRVWKIFTKCKLYHFKDAINPQLTVSQFFEIWYLVKIFGETFIMSLKSTSFPKELKAFYLPNKTTEKKSETQFCRRKTAEDNNAKIKVLSNIPCTFFLFKASAFLQIFVPRNLLFRKIWRMSVSLNSKCLKTNVWKHQIKEHIFLYLLTNSFL